MVRNSEPSIQGKANWRKILLPPRLRNKCGHMKEFSRLSASTCLGAQCSVFLTLTVKAFAHRLLKLEAEGTS